MAAAVVQQKPSSSHSDSTTVTTDESSMKSAATKKKETNHWSAVPPYLSVYHSRCAGFPPYLNKKTIGGFALSCQNLSFNIWNDFSIQNLSAFCPTPTSCRDCLTANDVHRTCSTPIFHVDTMFILRPDFTMNAIQPSPNQTSDY